MNDQIEILPAFRLQGRAETGAGTVSATLAGRSPTPDVHEWLAAALDELDYGVVLLDPCGDVIHVNQTAEAQLAEEHPLRVIGDELQTRNSSDGQPFRVALANASERGLRKLLTLGSGCRRATISIVPLGFSSPGDRSLRAVLVVLEKRSVCESLSVAAFARSSGLTNAEARVLDGLCGGSDAGGIADHLGVSVSTVRTQIIAIRAKTGDSSIRSLVRRIAMLPPLRTSLRQPHSPTTRLHSTGTC